MDLGKPISGLPKPAASRRMESPPPEPATGTQPRLTAEIPADQRAGSPAGGDAAQPQAPAALAETIKIAMPGSWKFFHAFLFFVAFLVAGNITANLVPSGWWRLGVLTICAPTYALLLFRIMTSSISGSAARLVVPSAGGVQRRQLTDVVSVSLPDPQFNRSGTFRMTFGYGNRQTFQLVMVIFQQQNAFGSSPTQRTVDTKWIYAVRSVLHSAGIRTIYTGPKGGLFA